MDTLALISQFGSTLYTLGSFVLVLSVIVFVHEYGHYIVGRWSGIYPEVFSLGFGPVLWSRVDRRGTKWQIAAVPFGGFVKFMGDADAASGQDREALSAAAHDPETLRKTMHGAPLWARSATVAAGPVFNFLLAIAIFTGFNLVQGQTREPLTVEKVVAQPEEGYQLRPGDVILAVGGIDTPSFDDSSAWATFEDNVPLEQPLTYRVERDGEARDVNGPYIMPSVVRGVAPRSAASDAGLREGDVIVGVNSTDIFAFAQLKDIVEGGNGAPITLSVWREGEVFDTELTPRRTDEPRPDGGFATQWRIGIAGGMAFSPASDRVSILSALGDGTAQVWVMIERSLSGLKHMITGSISTCNLSGPVAIAETSGQMASQGFVNLIWLIAALSTGIGLLNLFPVPVLDGGHLVFFAYEAVTGRPPNERVMQVLMTCGLAIILSLMVFSISNDLLFC